MASVRQENRYIKLIIKTELAITDRQRELEAAFMNRPIRHEVIPPKSNATKRQVRSWMRRNSCDYDDATSLAEGANAALDLPHGALDDECHWVWDEALSAIDGAMKGQS